MAGSFQGVIPFRLKRGAQDPVPETEAAGVTMPSPVLTLPRSPAGALEQGAPPGEEARSTRSMDSTGLKEFERTFLPHMSAAYNLARWLTRSDQDAEDVVQEAYLRAVRFFETFRGGNSKAWFLTIVRNTGYSLSLIHISEPTRLLSISYAVF